MNEPLTYMFAPDNISVVVHFEGSVYSFDKHGAPLNSVTNPRTRAIIRALLNAAINDMDAQVSS